MRLPGGELLFDVLQQGQRFAGEQFGQAAAGRFVLQGFGQGLGQRRYLLQPELRLFAGDGAAWQLIDPGTQLRHELLHQRYAAAVQLGFGRAQIAELFFQCRRHRADGLRVHNPGAAAQGMQAADHRIVRAGGPATESLQPVVDLLQVLLGVAHKDFHDRRLGGRRIAHQQLFCALHQRRRHRICGPGVAEMLDQYRQRFQRFGDQLFYRRRHGSRAIQATVQQVFHRPAEFAYGIGADHPATALERVKCAAHFLQLVQILGVALESRPGGAQLLQDFGGLFQEDFANLRVHIVGHLRNFRGDSFHPGLRQRRGILCLCLRRRCFGRGGAELGISPGSRRRALFDGAEL